MDAIEAMAMNREVIKATEGSFNVMRQGIPDADKVQDMLEDQADMVNHAKLFISEKYIYKCMCVCVCVCIIK